jgi:hypothetical protein
MFVTVTMRWPQGKSPKFPLKLTSVPYIRYFSSYKEWRFFVCVALYTFPQRDTYFDYIRHDGTGPP